MNAGYTGGAQARSPAPTSAAPPTAAVHATTSARSTVPSTADEAPLEPPAAPAAADDDEAGALVDVLLPLDCDALDDDEPADVAIDELVMPLELL
ncbi:uncharacterized protein RHOBADRAFT_64750, partial [Rhodotorula graminis WP1]